MSIISIFLCPRFSPTSGPEAGRTGLRRKEVFVLRNALHGHWDWGPEWHPGCGVMINLTLQVLGGCKARPGSRWKEWKCHGGCWEYGLGIGIGG